MTISHGRAAERGAPVVRSAPRGSPFALYMQRAQREGHTGRASVASTWAAGSAANPRTPSVRVPEDPHADLPYAQMTRDSVAKGGESDEERPAPGSVANDIDVGPMPVIDPTMQMLLATSPRSGTPAALAPEAPRAPDVRTPMEQLMSKLVRRVAWSGNARTGTARLELGAGELEGATLLIQADDGAVRVTIDLPPGVDRCAWRDRIAERLGSRGLHIADIEVT